MLIVFSVLYCDVVVCGVLVVFVVVLLGCVCLIGSVV